VSSLAPRALVGRMRRALAAAPPVAVLALGWLVLIVYAFPGQMTRDSYSHLREARSGIYTDGHPPVINLIWKLVDAVVEGPFGMLVLQSTMLLAGMFFVFRHMLGPRRAAWLAVAVFLYPPVFAPMAVIWKDCLMAGFLSLGIASLLSKRRWSHLTGLAALFGATAVRYNALAATLPLVVLLFQWRPGARGLRRYAIALASWLVLTVAAFRLNAALTDRPMHFWYSSLAVHDIVGTHAQLDEDLPDAQLAARLAGTELLVERDIHRNMRAVYDPSNFFPILSDPERPLWRLPIIGTEPAPRAQRDAIGRAWWATVTEHPFAYLVHRLRVFATVLSFGDPTPPGAVTPREAPAWTALATELGTTHEASELQRGMTRALVAFSKRVPVFVPWIYFALSVLCAPLAFRQRDVLAVLLSGLSFQGGLLFLAPSPDYRYSHWMVSCTVVGLAVLATRRYRHARPAANTKHAVASQASAQ